MSNERELTIEIAEQFLKGEFMGNFDEFTHISDDAAYELSEYRGDSLRLNGLQSLSESAATSLAWYNGDLQLNGLRELPNEVARAMTRQTRTNEGTIALNGLRSLGNDVAENLAQYARNKHGLELNGLESLSAPAAMCLATIQGYLKLNGLKTLPNEVAEELANHNGSVISLMGLLAVSRKLAKLYEGKIEWQFSDADLAGGDEDDDDGEEVEDDEEDEEYELDDEKEWHGE